MSSAYRTRALEQRIERLARENTLLRVRIVELEGDITRMATAKASEPPQVVVPDGLSPAEAAHLDCEAWSPFDPEGAP